MNIPAHVVAYNFLDHPNVVRRPAHMTTSSHVPVLAAFDPDNGVIRANDQLQTIVERGRRSMRVLRDEDTETLAHEFAKALNYKDIFQNDLTRADRLAALRMRRTKMIMRSTAESFANQKLYEERKAEEITQRIRMEILSAFDRKEHGSGLLSAEMGAKALESAADIVQSLRADYLDCARREYVRLHSALRGSEADASPGSRDRPLPGKVFRINEIRWLFPTKLSSTLADLVDEMIRLRIEIVIS